MGLFVRKVPTASNAVAVQIARTRRARQEIVEHLGSAHDDAELAVLVAVARERIQVISGQASFDLGALSPVPAAAGAAVVVRARSRVLWDLLEAAYTTLGFDRVGTDVFKQLVLARVAEPASRVGIASADWAMTATCLPAAATAKASTLSAIVTAPVRSAKTACPRSTFGHAATPERPAPCTYKRIPE